MMGKTHMLGGAAAWLTFTAATHPHKPLPVLAGSALAVAGALAVDLDHPRAEAAQMARMLGAVALATGAVAWIGHQPYGPYLCAAGLALAALPGAVAPHTGGYRGIVHTLWMWAAVTVACFAPVGPHWPVWAAAAVVTGWTSHLALDALTKEGLPLLARPWKRGPRFAWLPKALSMTTGGKRPKRGKRSRWRHARNSGPEYWLVRPALTIAIVLSAALTLRGYR